MTGQQVLSAPLDIEFGYTRSLGPVLGRFCTGLRERKVYGVRTSDGRVHVPPVEFDPVTRAGATDWVEVEQVGVVRSWAWVPEPLPEHPSQEPFAWALVQLDGADTELLHAVVGVDESTLHTGMRVRIDWVEEPTGAISDIACFVPADNPAQEQSPVSTYAEPVSMITTPVRLSYTHSVGQGEATYLRALEQGRFIGQRCPRCEKVYVPPRGACPTDGVPTTDEVALPDQGIVTTFCIVNVPFLGQRIEPPYVSAYILLDGADIAFLHLVLGCKAEEVRMGMRVEAVWKPRDQWGKTLANVDHFRPTGEPDAAYETYSHHL